jgi:hypothetical protein
MTGEHVPVIKIGRTTRYRLSDLERVLDRNTIGGNAACDK